MQEKCEMHMQNLPSELHEATMKKCKEQAENIVEASGQSFECQDRLGWNQEQHLRHDCRRWARQRQLSHKEQETVNSATCTINCGEEFCVRPTNVEASQNCIASRFSKW